MPARSVTKMKATTVAPVSAPMISERTRITCSSRWPNCAFHFSRRSCSQLPVKAFCGSDISGDSLRAPRSRDTVLRNRNYFRRRRHQFWAAAKRFRMGWGGNFFYDLFPGSRKLHEDDSMVGVAMQPPQQPHACEAIDSLNGSVVLHKKTRLEMLNGSGISLRHTSDGEKKLKLFRFQPGHSRGFFAIREKQAN